MKNSSNDTLLGVVALICCAIVLGLIMVLSSNDVSVIIDYDAPKSVTYTQAPYQPGKQSYATPRPAQRATQRPTVKPAPSKPNKPRK